MSDVSLDRVLAFNQELAALSSTGLPLDVGIDGPSEQVVGKLERINAAFRSRVGRGQSVEQAIAEEIELPTRYRTVLRTAMRCDDPTIVLNLIAFPAEARRQFGRSVGQAMVYPLIVLSFSFLAFWLLCDVTAPKIAAIYGQLWREPSNSLSFLLASRNLIPFWGTVIPLLIISAVVWWMLRSSRAHWNWVPGSSRYFNTMRQADLANQLATLLEGGCTLDESLAIVSPTYVDDRFRHGPSRENEANQAAVSIESFAPLLRWAVRGDLGGEPLPRVLRIVAQTYRASSERQRTILRVMAPTICGALLGGLLVLGYGLSLFIPIIQLLYDVSLPGGA